MQHFTLDSFLQQLKDAANTDNPEQQVYQVMQRVFTVHIDNVADIFRQLDDDVILYEDSVIAVLHYLMPTGVVVPPHDHQLYAIIGVYEGVEENHFYQVMNQQLIRQAIKPISRGEVMLIHPEGIHSVQTANNQRSAAIHVYLGELTKVKRSRFDWNTGEATPLNSLEGGSGRAFVANRLMIIFISIIWGHH